MLFNDLLNEFLLGLVHALLFEEFFSRVRRSQMRWLIRRRTRQRQRFYQTLDVQRKRILMRKLSTVEAS